MAKMAGLGRVGIVGGGGWLGSTIARAVISSGLVGPEDLICSYRGGGPRADLPCRWTADNRELAGAADIILLSVQPRDWPAVKIDARGKLVVSVMAGVSIAAIAASTGTGRVARALPNAAAEVLCSYTPFHVASPDPEDAERVRALFSACGMVDEVAEERFIDYFVAMSGSGPAFPALLAEALMDDAVERGLPPGVAMRAAQQVIVGAGRLQEHGAASPADTVRAFVDYDGTTAAGIRAMQAAGFGRAVRLGLEAALAKGRQMSDDHLP